uniref:Putative gamma-glutamyltransferase YwrD n=1 Tax=Hippocampus comes TaxID=109280 RepID=A0A3Q2Z448_HIPCM
MDADLNFSSRRSPVICLHGCVASSQPLASATGLDVLKRGGNAADAAVAIAAALAVTEPCSTGPGGDAFCLFFNSDTGEIRGINGSGRSPKGLTLEFLKGRKYCAETPPPVFDALNVTVPGAPACWCDTIQMFGSHKLSLREVLNGAVELAEVGFPVAEITAHGWTHWVAELRNAGKELGGDLLIDGHPPKQGQVFRNPALARTLKELGEHGKAAFYQGRVAQAIIDIIVQHGGVMTLDDLTISHTSTSVTNISLGHNSADYIHILVEAIRLAQTDAKSYVGDPDHVTIPLQSLLEKKCSSQRAQLINMDRCLHSHGHQEKKGRVKESDTVYFCVVDCQGNACSFINSTFMGFGTGLVPKDCGFSLQNRGASFSLHQNSVNCVAGGKRPYHTIIPALLTDCASESQKPQLLASLGVMGALMQPQGHIQVLLNMLEFGMNPQQALDSPRIFVEYDLKENQWSVNLEEGINQEVAEVLRRRGHKVNWPVIGHKRSQFGRGQIITIGDWWNPSASHNDHPTRVLWAGSDPRSDGCAMGF